MPPRPPKDPATIGSFAELRAHYNVLYGMYENCHKMKGATNEALGYRTAEVRGVRAEVKTLRRGMVQMTKQQHATEKLKSCGTWSGAAIGCVTLLWTAFEEYGYPGPKWLFTHDFVYGSVCWCTTLLFGWAAKAFHTGE